MMTPKIDKREEGLRALARMMAAAYRRRVTGETGTAFTALRSGKENPGVESKTAQYTELEDLRQEGSYTETVKVENFIRRKANQVGNSRNCRVAKESE